jgi:hypothetical protein
MRLLCKQLRDTTESVLCQQREKISDCTVRGVSILSQVNGCLIVVSDERHRLLS